MHQEEVFLDAHFDDTGTVEHAQCAEQRGEENQGNAKPIDAKVVTGVELRNPLGELLKLHSPCAGVVGKQQIDAEAKREQAGPDRSFLD